MSPLPAPVDTGLRALVPSVVRTALPLVVLALVRVGFTETSLDMRTLEWVLSILATMAYYVVVRVLERNWSKIGWLLGYPAQPVYVQGEILSAQAIPTPPTTTTVIEAKDPGKPEERGAGTLELIVIVALVVLALYGAYVLFR